MMKGCLKFGWQANSPSVIPSLFLSTEIELTCWPVSIFHLFLWHRKQNNVSMKHCRTIALPRLPSLVKITVSTLVHRKGWQQVLHLAMKRSQRFVDVSWIQHPMLAWKTQTAKLVWPHPNEIWITYIWGKITWVLSPAPLPMMPPIP